MQPTRTRREFHRALRRWIPIGLVAAALGCGGGSEPAPDGGQDAGHWQTCCIDNRYSQCWCYSENCDGPFIANCGPGVCANYFPSLPMSDPCDGVE